MARRVARIVDAHDGVAAAEQAHTGRRPGFEPLECGEPCFGIPELLVGARRVDDAAGVGPRLRIAGTHRFEQAVAGVRMAIDQTGQHGLAPRIDRFPRRVASIDLGDGADVDDPVAVDRDRAVFDDAAPIVDSDHRSSRDQEIDLSRCRHRFLQQSGSGQRFDQPTPSDFARGFGRPASWLRSSAGLA